ncbi:adenosylmethionine--8-amino-7-oxononanoate transaminase [Candidatus Hydrogenedentota bacterium]
MDTTSNLRERDVRHLWHPYTEMSSFAKKEFPIIESAEGVFLHDTDGRALLDGIASWWCVNLGHSHPSLVAAIRDQAGKLQNSILGGMSHPSAIELAERIAAITPEGLDHVFFAGDGSCAVEAALKISLQYWANVDERWRNRFICLEDGYHGDTLGAVGVGYVETFHKDLAEVIMPSYRASSPHCAKCPCGKKPETCSVECFDSMEQLIHEHHSETAAVIVEPLCQGAAGIRIYPDEYLVRLRRMCDEYGLLLIADEIAVGFGRTGSMFACDHAGITPDIMTIGKGMTGGYMPMSAAVATNRIFCEFKQAGDRIRTFYHGHTYGGNPITSAVALAALDVYADDNVLELMRPRTNGLRHGISELGLMLDGSTALTLGLIGVVEVNEQAGGIARAARIASHALDHGLFIRPLGPSVYLWPPLTVSEDELARMLEILKDSVAETS